MHNGKEWITAAFKKEVTLAESAGKKEIQFLICGNILVSQCGLRVYTACIVLVENRYFLYAYWQEIAWNCMLSGVSML